MKKSALLILMKNPELGKVKTRLAKTIGDENALLVYEKLLLNTKEIIKDLDVDFFIFYSTQIIEEDIWSDLKPIKVMQEGRDLGDRMYNAFEFVFKQNRNKAILIGTDIFNQTTENINLAFCKLDEFDVVINPVEDGGYCLIGLNENYKSLFYNKTWSHEKVFSEAIEELNKINKTFFTLNTLIDIDIEADLNKTNFHF